MASNISELTYLYKQISVIEMTEKLKRGGIVWNKVSNIQYMSTVFDGPDCWDMYLTKMPNQSTVTLDFKKNLKFFYSINSDTDPNVISLYQEVIGDEDYDKDKQLMNDITQFKTAHPDVYLQFMHGGALAAGRATFLYPVSTSGGARMAGSATVAQVP